MLHTIYLYYGVACSINFKTITFNIWITESGAIPMAITCIGTQIVTDSPINRQSINHTRINEIQQSS
jgi:hypothetical protein